jgi:uncharacterized protein involved in exopolysaccharide biosynthesis/MinD-like ATPase involved in chromosome partitioning or flagellar assembly
MADYSGVLRRRWWLIVAVTLIGTVASVGYFKTAHKTYTAAASVYVTATGVTANQVSGGRTSGAVNLDTEAQVVQSTTVAQAAVKLMHSSESIPQLISQVSVSVPANSQVLAIACQAGSATGSALCAESFAQAYLNFSSSSTVATLNSEIKALQSRISTLQSNSAKLSSEVAVAPANSTQRATAQQQLNSDQNQLSSLNGQVAGMEAELANPSGGSIISNATPPSKATSPKPSLIVGSGFVVSLLIGLIAGFLADRKGRRIRGSRELAQLEVPVLMSLPLKKFKPTMTVAAPRSPASRAFAELAHVLNNSLGDGSHVILVTSATKGRAASYVAANLAVAIARNQPDVMLVCGNLAGSGVAGMIGLPPGPGLTEVLAGELPLQDASQHPTGVQRLGVITPGNDAATADDLRQDEIDTLIEDIRGQARYVVVEAPAVASGPDVYTLAHSADATVLVVEAPRTRRDDVAGAVQQLERMGTTVLGAVLMPSPARAGKGDQIPAASVSRAQLDAEPERRALLRAADTDPAPANGTANNTENGHSAEHGGLTDDPDATLVFIREPDAIQVDIRGEAGAEDGPGAPASGWGADDEAAGSLLKG